MGAKPFFSKKYFETCIGQDERKPTLLKNWSSSHESANLLTFPSFPELHHTILILF